MISFVVPAHNEELELPRTLHAIRAAAAALDQISEVIVVDDASSDATATIAIRGGARVVRTECRHIGAARNAGAREAKGDILFFVDADTRVKPSHIVDAVAALDAGLAGGGAWMQPEGKMPVWAHIFFRVFSVIYFGMNLGAGGFLFTTRDNFWKAGGFDERYFAGEEVYLSRALKKLGRFKLLHDPVLTSARKVRMHSAWHVLSRWFGILVRGPSSCRSRDRLDLWYDGRREAFSPE